ncbi:MAG: ATP-binding protein, partial [Dehalococcoidia bacterium]|nr:ATP-binding protein [Dehalococcoidia bacterium]
MPVTQEKVVFSWSGGKDSALALYEVQRGRQYEVVSLLTTVTQDYDRVSMHGVRRALLERQAESLGIPLAQIPISRQTSNQEYEDKMRAALAGFQKAGVSACVFGDLFLEDLRKYREKNLAQIGMKGLFP